LTYLRGASIVQQLDVVPILGRYEEETQLANYVTAQGVPVYSTIPTEIDIDLIDMSATVSGNPLYVDANGSRLAGLTELFNAWITSLSTFLSPLTYHGDELGVSALSTVFSTVHGLPIPIQDVSALAAKKLTKKPSKANIGAGSPTAHRVGVSVVPSTADYFQDWAVASVTSTYKYLTSIYKFHKIFILPTSYLRVGSVENIEQEQVNQVEPFRLNLETVSNTENLDFTGTSYFQRHLAMAEADVRTELAQPSEMQVELDQLTKLGRGGFFTDIAGMIGGDLLGIPGAKAIASAIGGLTGL